MDFSDLGKLGKLAEQMQNAYSEGLNAMNMAGEIAAEEMNPDHEVELVIDLSAQVENHTYHVDATVLFNIELNPVLEAASSPMGNLSALLDGLGVDLGDDKDAVMDQLGQPRAVGSVKRIDLRDLTLSDDSGKLDAALNKKGSLLGTIAEDMITFNCEGVFSYPDLPGCYAAIPSMEAMQEHLSIPITDLYTTITFQWQEPEKDNLKVNGTIQIKPL
jgi:hypothetical protein